VISNSEIYGIKIMFLVKVILALFITSLSSCDRNKESKTPPPLVTVAKVIKETIPIYQNYVGNTQSVRSVDISARVEGFLVERAFEDGADVEEGDLLFVIDPRQYQAEQDSAIAQLEENEASLRYAKEQVKRYKPLVEKDFITQDQFDQYVTAVDEAKAAVEADKAAIKLAELNLSYCRMYAPFDGRIGKRQFDVGNVVGATSGFGEVTTLATVVQLDPTYVYFSPSELELPQIMKQKRDDGLEVSVVLSDGSIHPHKGKVDFIDNTVDPATGTIVLRAVIPNPEKTLLPGQYAEVRLLLGTKSNALLVPEQAIQEYQGGSYVYIVGKDNKVESRDVVPGERYRGMTEIEKGLALGEQVIIEGLQKVKPGTLVQTKLAEFNDTSKEPIDPAQPIKK